MKPSPVAMMMIHNPATMAIGNTDTMKQAIAMLSEVKESILNCSASRPSIAAKTNEDGREVQTETLTVKARPLASGFVKAKTGDSTKVSVYNNWYKAVYQPNTSEPETPTEEPTA